jgi:hypothetical protein
MGRWDVVGCSGFAGNALLISCEMMYVSQRRSGDEGATELQRPLEARCGRGFRIN